MDPSPPPASKIIPLIRLMRPGQWTKNTLVAAACFFALWDPQQAVSPATAILHSLWAIVIFCIVSSGVYIFNDLHDIESDASHPIKRLRPLAAGEIRQSTANITSCIMLLSGLGLSFTLPFLFTVTVSAYIALQLTYSLLLKNIALLDVFIIAFGFVLRAIAGATAISVDISPWLLVCTFLLALFLALCKRRHEKKTLVSDAATHRSALLHYDQNLLDQLISITSAATIVSYAMYTLAAETCRKFNTRAIGFTIPFVIFGIFRYLDLVYRHKEGGQPEKTLLTDLPIIVNLILFAITTVIIFLLARSDSITI